MVFDRLITILPWSRINPDPGELTDRVARAVLGGYQALWHPVILSRGKTVPSWARATDPPQAVPGDLLLVPEPSRRLLPDAWAEQAAAGGAKVVEGEETRVRFLARLWQELPEEFGSRAGQVEADDFFALGVARLWVEMLTAYMNHVSTLDEEHFQKEVLAGAAAAAVSDLATRDDHLRAAFQLLAEARERLYGADIYLLDFCLLDPRAGMDRLGAQLSWKLPVNIIASGRTIEELQRSAPPIAAQLKGALDEATVELIGGEYEEAATTLLPFESHLWQFRRGAEAYRQVMGRVPVIFGRRRFGLARHVLQLLNRHEFLYLAHFCFDGGGFPTKSDAKVRWEAPDSSTIESLTRIPFAADSALEFLKFPSRLAKTIASDFAATLTLAHWPMPDSSPYVDLLRISRFANVFGKFQTLSHYFQVTDPPALSSSLSNDDYVSPYLVAAHSQRSKQPISEFAARHRWRAQYEQLRWLASLESLFAGNLPMESSSSPTQSSRAAEPTDAHREQLTGTPDRAASLLEMESSLEQCQAGILDQIRSMALESTKHLANLICPTGPNRESGTLVLNHLNFERVAVVPLADETSGEVHDSRSAARWATVSVPGMGYAWLAHESPPESSIDEGAVTVTGQVMRNDHLEVEIDSTTGGIRTLRDRSGRLPLIGQQLVFVGITPGQDYSQDATPGGDAYTSGGYAAAISECDVNVTETQVCASGPELAELIVHGELVARPCPSWASDSCMLRFRQRYRLGRGQRMLRVVVELQDLKPGAIDENAGPWQSYVASRFAWPDPRSVLVRGTGTLAESTRTARPESPYFVEVHGRHHRVAIVTGGLPFHQRVGKRMLDVLLVAGQEACREFEFGLGVDLANPFHAALELLTEPVNISVDNPPASGPRGWFFHLDARNIVVTSMTPLDGERRGVRLHLFESAGRYTRARLRCPRNVAEARLTDFHGQRLATLDAHGDAVDLDLAPHELTQLEIEFALA